MTTLTDRLSLELLAEDGSDPVTVYRQAINSNAAALDVLNLGLQDILQPGVVGENDWAITATIVGGIGTLGTEGFIHGTAWLPDPVISGALMRSVRPNHAALSGLVAPALPTSGKYINLGFELAATTWGAPPTVSLVAGAEQTTEAAAIAAPAAESVTTLRIKDVVVKNTAGVYSIVHQRDRRPWANGASATIERTSGNIVVTSGTPILLDATGLALRVECSGLPVRVFLDAAVFVMAEERLNLGFRMDGVAINGTADGALRTFNNPNGSAGVNLPVATGYEFTPAAGSHLFQVTGYRPSGSSSSTEVLSIAAKPLLFGVKEVRPSANNGTS